MAYTPPKYYVSKSDLLQQLKGFEELINAGRAMIDGKGWHEIDGKCSICQRFIAAVEAAEHKMHPTLGESPASDSESKPATISG